MAAKKKKIQHNNITTQCDILLGQAGNLMISVRFHKTEPMHCVARISGLSHSVQILKLMIISTGSEQGFLDFHFIVLDLFKYLKSHLLFNYSY